MQRTQVLVAGAGPAGVVAAYRLAKWGIDVTLIEQHAEYPEDMRASTLHIPTIEMLAELGVLDTLEAQGLRAPVYQYRNRRSGEVLSFDLSELGDVTAHPYRLQCEQFKLTRLLTGLLANHPHGCVRFGNRLIYYEQDEAGVIAHLETPFAIKPIRCDFLIGADGANSLVRKWMGVQFEGFTYPEKFLTLSTAYPIEQSYDDLAKVNYMADAAEWCVLLRVPDLWRVLVPADADSDDALLLSDAKKDAVFGSLVPGVAGIATEHRTLYRVHQRVAKTYVQGRVILAGDAAHLNNPLGGFGMNSGVHDAWNITDKLRAILLEGAPHAPLFAHYERQRRTVMNEFVQAQTIKNKQEMEQQHLAGQQSRQTEFEAILADPERRRAYLFNQSMLTSRAREAEIA